MAFRRRGGFQTWGYAESQRNSAARNLVGGQDGGCVGNSSGESELARESLATP